MTGDVEGLLAQACADLACTMARSAGADEVLRGIAGHARRILSIRDAGVLLVGEDGSLSLACATDDLLPDLVTIEQDVGKWPSIEAATRGTVAPVHAIVDAAEAWPDWLREARARGVGAWLAVPSSSKQATVVLVGASIHPRQWRDAEVAAIRVLADLAAGAVAQASEVGRVRRVADQLQEALDHRLVIEQAKGVLVGEYGCTLDQAFAILRRHARRNNVTVRSVAQAVVSLGLRPPLERPRGPSKEAGPPWNS
jgi:GAF domain-containing protein